MKPHPAKAPKPRRVKVSPEDTVRAMYRTLSREWGRQHWWPAATPFEVIAGAILTQNTSWTNVEHALGNLRAAGLLSIEGVDRTPLSELEQLVRSSGYFRQKAQRLKNFVAYVKDRYDGSLEKMFAETTEQLRAELLTQNGIGPETADSILLYAGQHEVFVVDAYTRRILERHEAISANIKYEQLRALVERALHGEHCVGNEHPVRSPKRPMAHEPSPMSTAVRSEMAQVLNEMHGLFVQVGKHYCFKVNPDCENCPLGAMLIGKKKKSGATLPSTMDRQ